MQLRIPQTITRLAFNILQLNQQLNYVLILHDLGYSNTFENEGPSFNQDLIE